MISAYLERVIAQFRSGKATEHSYRPALYDLFQSIDPTLTVINEPKQSDGGMPDFMFQRDGVPIGWAEAKDINKDVIKLKGYSVEQRKRYEAAYPNLIYTNGVDFEFIRDGETVHFVSIAAFMNGLRPAPQNFDELERQLLLFAEQKPLSIRSASDLAKIMAAKAAIIKDEIGLALADDPTHRSGLGGQFKSFKANLLPNLEPDEFADIYAETITYGMFAARFHDDDLSTFSRQEAMEKLPASNPFLKGLFEYVAGPALPKRLTYIVDDLVQVMRASDPQSLFRDFGTFTARNDPFIHFYEDFLAAYNPKKRKSRGVWYTPEPVVDFIVRAVDEVLKSEFDLADGLADTSKVSVDWDTGQNHPKTGRPLTEKRQVHRVQILDPATGTGTFLAKTVQLISDRVKSRAPGKWSGYVEQDLLPRLHGFELLMASYAMCHMKLDMQLTESGYKPSAKPPRLSVWLTNALEPAERDVRDLFFQPLAEEARGASQVKRQTPIMCVIGNPPYSGHSSNKGAWIDGLMEAYMVEPGGKRRLEERNPKWVKKDEHKFIRFAESLVEKNGGGIVGFITSHGYLADPTLRGMRWHLQKTFDALYVLDLHGNSNKKESAPGGGLDENVFDIMQGVSIIVAVKRGPKKPNELAKIYHSEIWGSRSDKNATLFDLSITEPAFTPIKRQASRFEFVPRSEESLSVYSSGFSIERLMLQNTTGIQSGREDELIGSDKSDLEKFLVPRFPRQSFEVVRYLHKPFDFRWFAYFNDPGPFMDGVRLPKSYRARNAISVHLQSLNLSLLFARSNKSSTIDHFFVSETISDVKCAERTTGSMFAPLYLYAGSGPQTDAFAGNKRTLNLDPKLYGAICKSAGIDPADQAVDGDFRARRGDARPSEIKVFDYIYGVLHSLDYRATYAEFLKIDYPRIPYPPTPELFREVSGKGEALRRLHLMEAAAVGETPYPYHGEGDDVVATGYPKIHGGKVYINREQYFDAVPEVAWTFSIGGYQPAQKWLKDRRGLSLSWSDVGHYQKILKILSKTDQIMREIKVPVASSE